MQISMMLTLALVASPADMTDAPDAPGAEPGVVDGAAEQETVADPEAVDPNRLEIGGTPALGYDNNTGFAFGAIVTLAKFSEEDDPYAWRLEALAYMSVMELEAGRWDFPFHDHHVLFDAPGLWDGRLRLNLKVAFSRTLNNGYYGFGNGAAYDESLEAANSTYYQYDWIHPHADAKARIRLWHGDLGKLDLIAGTGFTYNVINVFDGSLLAGDLAGGSGSVVQDLVVGASNHSLLTGIVGVSWDTRDHDFSPSRGMFHEVSLRGGAGLGEGFGYGGANATSRFFFPLWGEYCVLAARMMVDVSFGDVPIYLLPSHEGLYPGDTTGGASSIRGVPGKRYHGKVKVLGNLELRSKILPFEIYGERFNLGAITFVDAGRVWAELEPRPDLDDGGARYKVGAGGGLRLQWGETFILRGDVAYSPTEDTLGYYVDINHIF